MRVTEKCDVYSFGVVALEIMMGRHPGELLQSLAENGEVFVKDVLDQRLLPPTGRLSVAAVLVVSIALCCTGTSPDSRPTMCFVAQQLSASRNYNMVCLAEPLRTLTINKLCMPSVTERSE